ncbi:MAG: MBL fold metallo-hydrolase [Lachnospiraceae bacterium]|jgi:ribonuclease BN (tRNA processing enzyme)|nr:MBL fold metallo-hydrolase [Lachnospiraceae bacterium]
MKISILGSAGWMPSDNRQTTSIMVRNESTLLLFDAGTGVANLQAYEDILERYDELHVFLSHYHLDHTMGICFLPRWFRDRKITFHVPARTLGGMNGEEVLGLLHNTESFPISLSKLAAEVKVKLYEGNTAFMAGDLRLETKAQTHSNPSFAVKINDLVCFATDTIVDKSTFSWANDVRVLFHECWSDEKDGSGHSSYQEILAAREWLKQSANEGGTVPKIYLIHQNPMISWSEYCEFVAESPDVVLARDMMDVTV